MSRPNAAARDRQGGFLFLRPASQLQKTVGSKVFAMFTHLSTQPCRKSHPFRSRLLRGITKKNALSPRCNSRCRAPWTLDTLQNREFMRRGFSMFLPRPRERSADTLSSPLLGFHLFTLIILTARRQRCVDIGFPRSGKQWEAYVNCMRYHRSACAHCTHLPGKTRIM